MSLRAAYVDDWDDLGPVVQDLRPADFATMANAITGLVSMVATATGHLDWAAWLILLAILLDGLDGAIARMGGGGGPLGPVLDSMADMVSFAAAPALLLTRMTGLPEAVPWLVAGFYLLTVMVRLARFEALGDRRPERYFSGLSSSAGGLVVAALTLAILPPAWTAGLVVLASLLMVSRFRYPKLRGGLGITAVLLILATLIAHGAAPAWSREAAWGLGAFMAVYALIGPFYVLNRFAPTSTESS